MFSLDGIMGEFVTFFQEFFANEILSFLTGLLGNFLPAAG